MFIPKQGLRNIRGQKFWDRGPGRRLFKALNRTGSGRLMLSAMKGNKVRKRRAKSGSRPANTGSNNKIWGGSRFKDVMSRHPIHKFKSRFIRQRKARKGGRGGISGDWA